MQKTELTFNDLPQVVAQLRDEVMGMRLALEQQQRREQVKVTVKANKRRPMTVAEAIAYTGLPKGTFYMKLENGAIPAIKPGKRWLIYQNELDKWLEANRRGDIPLTAEEENEAILQSHRRKPNKQDWREQSSTDTSNSPYTSTVAMASSPSTTVREANETDATNEANETQGANTTDAVTSTNPVNDVPSPAEEPPATVDNPTVTDEQSVGFPLRAAELNLFNAADATSSFERMKEVYGKIGNNEAQAFSVWQRLSEEERTAAFAHVQQLQGDLVSRSYLYVYLRDKEWTKVM